MSENVVDSSGVAVTYAIRQEKTVSVTLFSLNVPQKLVRLLDLSLAKEQDSQEIVVPINFLIGSRQDPCAWWDGHLEIRDAGHTPGFEVSISQLGPASLLSQMNFTNNLQNDAEPSQWQIEVGY